jgi:hypothetical protein
MDTINKKQESRVRSLATRRGHRVLKSRQQIHLDNCGEYMLLRNDDNICVLGNRYDATLDDIEEYFRD